MGAPQAAAARGPGMPDTLGTVCGPRASGRRGEETMVQKKSGARAEIRRLADLVRDAVEDGATSAEEIHKRIAGMPLDLLERIDVLQDAVGDVRKVQERSIGAVYELIRRVNREISRLALEVLEGGPGVRPRARKTARRARGRVRRAQAAASEATHSA